MSKDIAIEIENLNYSYKSQWLLGSKPGIKNINLKVAEGESFAFLGSNGAGKTTTIKALLGLIKPDSGESKIFGISSRKPEARAKVGYVSERPYFYDNLTVFELLELYASLVGIKSRKKKHIEAALCRVGIQHKANARLRGLSKGQTQRVAMAQAILAEPKLLILDEPMSGLDPVARREFRDLLLDLNSKGTTIFMSSHILGEVGNICSKASIMTKGEIRAIIDTQHGMETSATEFEIVLGNFLAAQEQLTALAKNSRTQGNYLHLVIENREKAEQVLKLASEKSVKLESFTPLRESLEDLFLKITG